MKYLACVLVACVAWIGGTASAAPTGLVQLFGVPGAGIHRFTDVGKDSVVTCYLIRGGSYGSSATIGISCVRLK